MNLFQLEPIIVQKILKEDQMDPSSSSTTQYNNNNNIKNNQDHQQHRLGLQDRDWLSCSTSTPSTTQDVTIEDEKGGSGSHRAVVVEREHMFDKVVTPSDVGKLNRLVIPKQHAEKYFPLDTTTNNNNNNNSSCASGNNNNNNESKTGLLLNFEDRTGKSWRFRYSYWNSSQSYVMTKGWSRFVKEKQLSAGDIVSFQRAVGDDVHSKNTFFIDWRRRPPDHHHLHHHHHHLGTAFSVHHSIPGWGGNTSITTPSFFLRSHPHDSHPHPHSQPHHNALWDHYSNNNNFNNNNINNYNNINNNNHNNVTHLSPMNGNIMNMVPYTHVGSGSGSGPGSLILLRSPIPNSASIINHHPYHLNRPSWPATPREAFQETNRVYDSVPIVHGKAPASSSGGGVGKRSLRLFGVNMEYDHQLQHNSGATNLPPSSNNTSTSTNLDNAPQN